MPENNAPPKTPDVPPAENKPRRTRKKTKEPVKILTIVNGSFTVNFD